jgi:hypothetical protein
MIACCSVIRSIDPAMSLLPPKRYEQGRPVLE